MKLEIERLRLNLSAAERDRALLSIGVDPATINPNVLLDESYTRRLCRVAGSLALLGQTSLEDKINAAIGLEIVDDDVLDFWNINAIGESCCGGMCQVRAESQSPGHASFTVSSLQGSQSVFLCLKCQRKACKVCCAGKGALLLESYTSMEVTNSNGLSSQSGSNHGSQVDGCTNQSVMLDGVICKYCCNNIVLDALILDYVRVLISLRRSARVDNAAHNALDQAIGFSFGDCISERKQSSVNEPAVKVLGQLLNGQESLAEFPFASFLHPVLS